MRHSFNLVNALVVAMIYVVVLMEILVIVAKMITVISWQLYFLAYIPYLNK
jgi:hypothetical protein